MADAMPRRCCWEAEEGADDEAAVATAAEEDEVMTRFIAFATGTLNPSFSLLLKFSLFFFVCWRKAPTAALFLPF